MGNSNTRPPHHYLVNGVDPQKQQRAPEKNYAAHAWLWVFLAVGLIILGLLALGLWLDNRRKNRQEKEDKKKDPEKQRQSSLYPSADVSNTNLYPNPAIEEKRGLFQGSVTTTTSEIQPKAPPMSSEKINEMSRNSFGMANITSSTDYMHSSSATSRSSISLAGNSKRISKMESFPYEEYGIPENERQPIKTRVTDLKTYDHFLHLTPIDADLLRDDSIVEEDSHSSGSTGSGNDNDGNATGGRFESQATLPRSSIDKSVP